MKIITPFGHERGAHLAQGGVHLMGPLGALSHGTRRSARHEAIRLGTGEAEADLPVHRPCTQDYRCAWQVKEKHSFGAGGYR